MKVFKTSGVCAKEIHIEIEAGIIKDVNFISGCAGNLLGIRSLVKDKPVSEVIESLKGIQCGSKMTSCPDQLARALSEMIE